MYQFDAESVLMERETNRSTHAVHSADIKTIEDTPEENRKFYDLIIKLKLPFDQLINEHGFDWIHVSYGPRHRRQKLRAVRKNGRTQYLAG